MEEVQRRIREGIDEVKRDWQPKLAGSSTAPKFNFSKLAAVPRAARSIVTGRNLTRVETLYTHIQEEIDTLRGQLSANEQPVVLFPTGLGATIQVGSIGYRNPDLLIVEGLDDNNQRTRILAQAGSAQFVLRVVSVAADAQQPAADFQFSGNLGPA
jgi:hypothetical protein